MSPPPRGAAAEPAPSAPESGDPGRFWNLPNTITTLVPDRIRPSFASEYEMWKFIYYKESRGLLKEFFNRAMGGIPEGPVGMADALMQGKVNGQAVPVLRAGLGQGTGHFNLTLALVFGGPTLDSIIGLAAREPEVAIVPGSQPATFTSPYDTMLSQNLTLTLALHPTSNQVPLSTLSIIKETEQLTVSGLHEPTYTYP